MTEAARKLFLHLETNPMAPEAEFASFVVGDALDDGYLAIRDYIEGMMDEKSRARKPSRAQLVIAENGNGKTLLANRIKSFLSARNLEKPGDSKGPASLRFDAVYSHISALGQASSQTILDIATNLRRSQMEESEFTYSLIAIKIAQDFELTYRPPRGWRIAKILGRAGARWATAGLIDQLGELDEAIRTESEEGIRKVLDHTSRYIQERLGNKHYKFEFTKYLGDLEFESFVKCYFTDRKVLGVAQLKKAFLDDVGSNPTLQQPKVVVEQLGRIAKKVGCSVIVIIIDDCNQIAFIDQLLPLINDLSKFENPRVLLVINMVKSVADKLEKMPGDRSGPQRLFYNTPIELPGPTAENVRELYERIRKLHNDAFVGERATTLRADGLGDRAVAQWSRQVGDGKLEANYRSAINFLIAYVQSPLEALPNDRLPRTTRSRRVRV